MGKMNGYRAIVAQKIGLIDARTNGRTEDVNGSDFAKSLLFPSIQNGIRRKKYDNFRKNGAEIHIPPNGWCEVRIIGMGTLFFPPPFTDKDAEGVLAEAFRTIIDPSSDHYYEKKGTIIEQGDIVADCGAAEGAFALSVHKRCRKVFAIEPNRHFVDCMRKTFEEDTNIEIVQAGLSDKKETAQLMDDGCASRICEGKADYDVELTTLDDLFYYRDKRLDYLKADLEGYEIKMLNGAKKTIKEFEPRISITTYHVPSHSIEIRDLLLEINPDYRIYTIGMRWNKISGSIYCWPAMLHAWIEK